MQIYPILMFNFSSTFEVPSSIIRAKISLNIRATVSISEQQLLANVTGFTYTLGQLVYKMLKQSNNKLRWANI